MTQTTPAAVPDLPANTWERAYADVLFSHIDRLNDVCETHDPLERIVQSLRDAFDRVAVTDPVMNRNEVWRALRADEPWPEPGASVWYLEGMLTSRPLKPAQVLLTFRGKDDSIWCVLEVGSEYVTKPVLALSMSATGPTNLELALRKPEQARAFLQRAGIVDEAGKLVAQYTPSEDDNG